MAKSGGGTALVLGAEVVPGFFFQVFGVGHILNGQVVKGFLIMVSYWALQAVNFLLSFIGIGVITGFLTWLGFLLLSPANIAANRGH